MNRAYQVIATIGEVLALVAGVLTLIMAANVML